MKPTLNTSLITLAFASVIAGCGDDKKSAGDQAKAATDAVTEKAGDIKDAVTGKTEESRAAVEARFAKESADMKVQIDELEAKVNAETIPDIKAAGKTRLDQLKATYTEANNQILDLTKSAEAEWKAKRDSTLASIESAKSKVASALDRQKLKEDANQKFEKIQAKINQLQEQATRATAEEKRELDESRINLEIRYQELQAQYNEFQRATDEKWDNFKDGFAKSFKELSDAFKGLFD